MHSLNSPTQLVFVGPVSLSMIEKLSPYSIYSLQTSGLMRARKEVKRIRTFIMADGIPYDPYLSLWFSIVRVTATCKHVMPSSPGTAVERRHRRTACKFAKFMLLLLWREILNSLALGGGGRGGHRAQVDLMDQDHPGHIF